MSPALLEALVIAAVKYGPGFATSVLALFKQKEITLEQVEALFANVKPYSDYGIPDQA
jgi:hypothetical protein